MTDRHSEANVPDLIKDPDQAVRVEAENALRQFDLGMEILDEWLKADHYRLRPSLILDLHRILLTGLNQYAGIYRPADVVIKGSKHNPPPAASVPRHVEDLCDYVNSSWTEKTAVHLAAYILWRLNWIHAFVDGNGRTARIVSYVVLCARSGHLLPGDLTIPEQISAAKQPYYDGLESADKAIARGSVDLNELEMLLSACLANQLYDFHAKASGTADGGNTPLTAEIRLALNEAKRQGVSQREAVFAPRGASRSLLAVIERHPALTGLIGTLLAALIAVAVALLVGK